MQRFRFLSYFTVSFLFACGAMVAVLHHVGLFEIGSVPIEIVMDGNHVHQSSALEVRLKNRIETALHGLRGKKIWDIDIMNVRAALARDEWVKDILISRSFPNEVRVIVRSKVAMAVLISEKGAFSPVTEDGSLLSPLSVSALPDVPILRGEIFKTEASRRLAIVKFLQTLPTQGPVSGNNISEVGWTTEDGYTLTLIQPKVEVKLGEDRVDLKALRVAQVLNYLSVNSLKGRVIDASYSKKVLVRLRKGS